MPGFQMVRPVHLKGDRVRETSKPSYVGWSRRRAPVRADSRRQGISQQTSKYRLFVWIDGETLPHNDTIAFALSDDYSFGVLHSRAHELWALRMGTSLEDRPRYTPTTCFETFPFPKPTEEQRAEIAAAAK